MSKIEGEMPKRRFSDFLIVSLKGMAMGAADIVPGVSGGTIAFISGIYEELLTSISAISTKNIKSLFRDGFYEFWQRINGNFLVALLIGIGISVVSLAKMISWLLEHEPILLWSFFFGLVLASVVFIAKEIKGWNLVLAFSFAIGTVLAYYVTTLEPMVTENSSGLYLFFAGAIAICAMILPGISGAFILVLLGAYKPVLDAIHNRDISLIALVGAGAVVGLLSFSKILKWLFSKFKNHMLAILSGFVFGSLNKIWPWKETLTWRLNSQGVQVPFNEKSVLPQNYSGDSQMYMAIVLAFVGIFVILLLEKIATRLQKNYLLPGIGVF